MSRRIKPALLIIAGLLTVLSGFYLWEWNHGLTRDDRIIVVAPGTTLRAFARELHRQEIISNTTSFVLLAHLAGRGRQLKAGEYEISAGASMVNVLDQVVAGRVIKYPVVLIEGWTFKQFLEAMNNITKIELSLGQLTPKEIMGRLGLPDMHPEGMFYPDTYHYTAGMTDFSLLKLAHERLQKRLQQEWNDREPDLPFKNEYEALILASIVEKETGLADERKMIAGVFINRLRRKIRLQSDPTVIYGMGDRYDGNIRLVDLRRDTPYNTYTRRGLPPTPIAMPGGDAINAVMHPADTRALYFVARGDGSHVFSKTLREHNAAVDKYQRRRRSKNTKLK
jgi:UPF0755 protein